jgi:Ca-activated chloride channel family protein
MAGRKIEMARQAVNHAIRLLADGDRLALVCYDTDIDVLLGATAATPEAKTLALTRLRTIDARGGTDLCGGWLRGAGELTARATATPAAETDAGAPLCRVLLLSDGQANEGETNPNVLARHAADLRAEGVATSTFGLGADFDERLMSRLATEGGGHFYFIEQPAQIADVLTSELGETLDVVARDARVIISGEPGVGIGCFNDFPVETIHDPVTGRDDVHVRLGDLVSGQEVTMAIAVGCPPRPAGGQVTIGVRLADRDGVLFPQPLPIEWQAVDEAANTAQPVNAAVIVEVARLMAERARAAALEANRRGDFAGAAAILKTAAADLRAVGAGIREVDALASELEGEQVEFNHPLAPLAMKARHFASYSHARSRGPAGKARKRVS